MYREGTKLMLDRRQYKFAGLNADALFDCWPGEEPSDAELDRYKMREANRKKGI